MIKKAALIVCTFSALVAAHLGYTQAFVLLENHFAVVDDGVDQFAEPESASLKRSKELAVKNFGTDHWTAQPDIKLTYYDASRGSFMYAQTYELQDDGKVMVISPFAMVAVSKDGLAAKAVTASVAHIHFNQPYGLLKKSAEPQRVVHAKLSGNVRIRDDKGTADDPKDDMLIGPLTAVEFDEKTMQVTSSSAVVIQDQDIAITGDGLMIQLRRKGPVAPVPGAGPAPAPNGGNGSGFEAETAFLYRNVDIVIRNVGSGNILPGQSKPDAAGEVPLHLQCVGQMRIDLPKPKPAPAVGPPNPYAEPLPTYARFEKNVQVTRGKSQFDQLNSEMLYLTLSPDRRLPPTDDARAGGAAPLITVAKPAATPAKAGSPMTALKLRTAFAQGKVWVQSESQGMNAHCVELKYDKKLEDGLPDRTYLAGGAKQRLNVEKVDFVQDGPKAGTIKEISTLESLDAEILDYGLGVSRIVAQGPGKSESKPSRTASVARVAWFEDRMMLVTTRDGTKAAGADAPADPKVLAPLRRLLTLTGPSKLMDVTSASTLDAKEKIVAEFESGPKPAAGFGGDGPSRIKWLEAFDNVHLASPGKTLTAWRKLDARFVPADPVAQPAPQPASAPAAGPAPTLVAANAPAPSPAADGDAPLPEARPEAPPAPVEGAVDGRANYVFATIQLGAGTTKGEVRDAKLRGGVMVHQDPAPGERAGKNASGEALDLYNQGKGMMKFAVAAEEPQAAAPEPKTKLAGDIGAAARSRLASGTRPLGPRTLARIDFDGKTIESEHILGLDQAANIAWGKGAGKFHQEADRNLLEDKGLASDPKHPKKGPGVRDQMTITWNDEMRFIGRSRDKSSREVAKLEFRGTSEEIQTPNGQPEFRRGVQARMTDSAITCDVMDVYLDRIIDLSKAAKTPGGAKPPAEGTPAEPQAEIALIEAWGDNIVENDKVLFAGVDVTSRKFFEGSTLLKDKYRIRHTHVIYDKRTGEFEAGGPGTVYLYKGKEPKAGAAQVRTTAAAPNRPEGPAAQSVELTKIQFGDLMKGRFGVPGEGRDGETKTAEFVGHVQTAHAFVASSNHDLDFDKLDRYPDGTFLTSEALRVESSPPPRGSKNNHELLFAAGNAAARTVDRLVQGDRITFDSASGVMYAYGDNDKDVLLLEQKTYAQNPSPMRGKALRYNMKTKQGTMEDPQSIVFYDLKSGIRPKANYPDLGGTPAKPPIVALPRAKPQRPARTATERNGFTGH